MKKNKLLAALTIILVVIFAGCKSDDFVEVVGVCPLVVSTDPANGTTNVPFDKIITATFNEEMNPATITNTTFTVQGASPVTGTVSYNGEIATFTPSTLLAEKTTFVCRISTSSKDLMGNALQTDKVWTFSTGAIILPVLIQTDPLNLTTAVKLNKVITATFSMPMDLSSLNANTFTLKKGTIPVVGSISGASAIVNFTPTLPLLPYTVYTATITTGAKNLAGHAIIKDSTWTFTTGDNIPTVLTTDPLNRATNVTLSKTVSATFSALMDATTINKTNFTLKAGAISILGTVNYAGTTATFKPNNDLVSNTVYTATIKAGVKNTFGTPLAKDTVWTFTTATVIAPTVIFTDPTNLDPDVALNKTITANFSEIMDNNTFNAFSFTLKEGTNPISGTISYAGTTAMFNPNSNLIAGTTYTATITKEVKNLSGVAMTNDYSWTFSTPINIVPPFVDLGMAARFAILSGVGISNNAGASVINNLDVGIYPGARSSITGFPPATIENGQMFAADDGGAISAMLLQAKNDLTVAYLFAEGSVAMAPQTVSGNQGGKTLAPGIYKSTSTLSVDGSDLTLDAQGNPNAYWIFQIASAFTTTTGGNIKLTNGAQAKNVFWQTGSSATIGTYTSFNGNILALTSITMGAYSTATGRMLARNGSVVMTSTNIINKP